MPYNPEKHRRRSLRLQAYDYTSDGMYFITICTHQRQYLFGKVVNGEMQLNKIGGIVNRCWQAIPNHFSKVQLDSFVIMPNHIHGILVITNPRRDMALPCPYPPYSNPQHLPKREFAKPIAGSLSTIVGSFKSAATKHINLFDGTPGTPVWQKNYYEHIIRSEEALQFIRQYIHNNPLSWQEDSLHSNYSSNC